jgi:hypothetical protein
MAWADVILGDGETAALTDGSADRHQRGGHRVAGRRRSAGGHARLRVHAAGVVRAHVGLRDGEPPLQMGIAHGRWATGAVAALERSPHTDARPHGYGPVVEVSALEVMAVCLNNYRPVPTVHRVGVVHVAAATGPGRPLQDG